MFRCNLPPALLAEWPGSHAHRQFDTSYRLLITEVTRGWNRHRIESAHKVNSGEENYPAASAGIRTRNLSITSLALLPTSCPGSPMTITSDDTQGGRKKELYEERKCFGNLILYYIGFFYPLFGGNAAFCDGTLQR